MEAARSVCSLASGEAGAAAAATPPPAWFVAIAKQVSGAVAKQRRSQFRAYPWVGVDDLASVAMQGALKAFPSFNRDRAKASTYVWDVAQKRITDHLRSCAAERRRVGVVRRQVVAGMRPAFVTDAAVALDGEELVDLAADVYAQVLREMRHYRVGGRGRRGYHVAQRAALLALMSHTGLTRRGMQKLLRSSPALCRALGLRRSPSGWFFDALGKSGRKLRRRLIRVDAAIAGTDGSMGCEAKGGGGGGDAAAAVAGARRLIEPIAGVPRIVRAAASPVRAGSHVGSGGPVAIGGFIMVRAMKAGAGMVAVESTPGPEISAAKAAQILGVSPGTLKAWRHRRRHLPFVKERSKVSYFEDQVRAFKQASRQVVQPLAGGAAEV